MLKELHRKFGLRDIGKLTARPDEAMSAVSALRQRDPADAGRILPAVLGPTGLAMPGIALTMVRSIVAGVHVIHPPRRTLPRWGRYLEGAPSAPAPPGGRS